MVELAPTYAHYWFTLGQFEYLHGEREEGIRALETALEQSPLNRRYAACLLSAYLKEYEKIVSPTKKNEMWRKSQTLFSKIISGKNAPNDSQLRAWMLQYNDSLIRQLRTSVSVPS